MADIVTLFSAEFNVHVGFATTFVPTKVAHELANYGVIDEGNIILIIPSDDKGSKVVMSI